MAPKNKDSFMVEKEIGGTVYIVRIQFSDNARETAVEKVKRLILHDIERLDSS